MPGRFKSLLLFILTLLVFSCLHKLSKPPEPGKKQVEKAENATVAEIAAYLKMAENAVELSDSLGAEFYYNKTLEIIENSDEAMNADSAFLSVKEQVFRSYDQYLGVSPTPSQDSLPAAEFIQNLDLGADSLGNAATDTSLVHVPDVIEGQHQMGIPLVVNRQVENAIKYFTTRGRKVFNIWLKRAGRYERLIKDILKEEGVPEELFYLGMIESGFNPHARSYARAVGIWQFISTTGRAYGLRHNWWFDERRDPMLSTRAAARHLKDLYDRFGDWYLAMAGYNYSPRKIEKRLQRKGVNEYWDLPRLPRQTRNYIPTFIAAATLAQDPEAHGFHVQPDPPVEFDTVTVRECVDLNVVAECVGSTFSEIKMLNPALLRWCTPPTEEKWVLNLPSGTREQFLANYSKVPDSKKLSWVHHRIRYGETLSTIARKYRVSISEIKRFNKIRGTLIRAGHHLVIPVPQNKQYYQKFASQTSEPSASRKRYKPVKNVPGREKYPYTVKRGDTLWDIARKFGVTVTQVRQWNGLGYSRIIRPGQQLNIWLPEGTEPGAELLAAKTKSASSGPAPGDADPPSSKKIIYEVREGDTLWDIAQQYGVSIRSIKRLNNMRSNLIRPGDRLTIQVSQ